MAVRGAARQVYRVFDEEAFLAGHDLEIVNDAARADEAGSKKPLRSSRAGQARSGRRVARGAPVALLAAGAGVAVVVALDPGRPAPRMSAAAGPEHVSRLRGPRRPRAVTRPHPKHRAVAQVAGDAPPARVVAADTGPSLPRSAPAGPSGAIAPAPSVPKPSQEFGFER
jgi:hypothetical protein